MAEGKGQSKLTVLMAVYNGSTYLRTAIDSVLHQTYPDFCFMIVDDASTDDTREIVRSYEDERIQLVCLEQNVGQTAALDIGLRRATTPWIARLDADDYSAPARLAEQMQVLEANQSLSCVGTYVWLFRDDPCVIDSIVATPLDHAEIKRGLLRGSPMVHGSIVVNREALLNVGGYEGRYRITADLDLYDRLFSRYTAANLPKPLVGIRQHSEQASRTKLAYDEAIEICSQRLNTDNYSREEKGIIRATLSRAYLYHARFEGRDHNYTEVLKDLAHAVRVSPNTFFWNCCLVLFYDRISEPRQAALRRVLSRSAPRFLTGR